MWFWQTSQNGSCLPGRIIAWPWQGWPTSLICGLVMACWLQSRPPHNERTSSHFGKIVGTTMITMLHFDKRPRGEFQICAPRQKPLVSILASSGHRPSFLPRKKVLIINSGTGEFQREAANIGARIHVWRTALLSKTQGNNILVHETDLFSDWLCSGTFFSLLLSCGRATRFLIALF